MEEIAGLVTFAGKITGKSLNWERSPPYLDTLIVDVGIFLLQEIPLRIMSSNELTGSVRGAENYEKWKEKEAARIKAAQELADKEKVPSGSHYS